MLKLSLRYWRVHRKKLIKILFAMILSSAALVMSFLLARSSTEKSVQDALNENGNYDIAVQELTESQLEVIKNNSEIAEYGLIQNGGVCCAENETMVPCGAFLSENAVDLFHYPVERGGHYPQKSGEIAGYESSFHAMGVAAVVGNKVHLQMYDAKSKKVSEGDYTISGVISNYKNGQPKVRTIKNYLDYDESKTDFPELFFYEQDIQNGNTMTGMVLCDADAAPYDVEKKLKGDGLAACVGNRLAGLAAIAVAPFQTQNELYRNAKSAHNDFYASYMVPASVIIIFILSFCSIYGMMSCNMEDRKKNLGLLECIGMSRKKCSLYLFLESILQTIAGIGLGYILGIALYEAYIRVVAEWKGIIIYNAFAVHPITRAVSLNPLVYPAVICFVIALAAVVSAIRRNLRRTPLEMLHAERGEVSGMNKNKYVIVTIMITGWTMVFGATFMLAKADSDSSEIVSNLQEISDVDSDYSISKDIYDTMVGNVQFNRHSDAVSQKDFERLKSFQGVTDIKGVLRIPGNKLLYKKGNIPKNIEDALGELNIDQNIVGSNLEELNRLSLKEQGYEANDVLYNVPALAVDDGFAQKLKSSLVSGEMDDAFLQGKSVILVAYESPEDLPFHVGDTIQMTDTCIGEKEYEQYDFSRNTMPKDRKPSFLYSYDDGSVKDLKGYSFGKKVVNDVTISGIMVIRNKDWKKLLYTDSYVSEAGKDEYVHPKYNILCYEEALPEMNRLDTGYTDVYIKTDNSFHSDTFEELFYEIAGKSTLLKPVSRQGAKEELMRAKWSNVVIFISVIILIVIVGILGMINSYTYAIKKNTRSICILRAIGMRQKTIRFRLLRKMLLWPFVAVSTSVIPIFVFDKIKDYAYHYAFDLGHNGWEMKSNGVMYICWQALFPWYIEMWKQPIIMVMLISVAFLLVLNLVALEISMKDMWQLSITEGMRKEIF